MAEQVRKGPVGVRAAGPEDAEFLVDMLLEAVNWSDKERYTRKQVLKDKATSLYVAGWQRDGDLGLIAVDLAGPSGLQIPIGAAWIRRFAVKQPGFGYISEDIPELTVAVAPHQRERGIGSALLRALITKAREQGIRNISLSVEAGNSAQKMFEAFGFSSYMSKDGATTMLLDTSKVRKR